MFWLEKLVENGFRRYGAVLMVTKSVKDLGRVKKGVCAEQLGKMTETEGESGDQKNF